MNDINIENLIPHRDRMKLINEIIEVDDKKSITAAIVSEEWPLFNNGSVDPVILIELVAQTTGIAVGWQRRTESGIGGEGWLVGIKRANFSTDRIPLGARLIMNVKSLYDHNNYGAFEGTVMSGSDILAKIEIQVFRPE